MYHWCQMFFFLKGVILNFQMVTFKMCNFPRGNLPKVRLGQAFRGAAGCNEGRALWLGRATGPPSAARTFQGPSIAARTELGSFPLVNCTFGKLPLGKIPLENYPWEVATWENAFGKVLNFTAIACIRPENLSGLHVR